MTTRHVCAALLVGVALALELGMVWGFHNYYIGHLADTDAYYLAFLGDHALVLGAKLSVGVLWPFGFISYTLWRKR